MGTMAAGLATLSNANAQNSISNSVQGGVELLIQGGLLVNASGSQLADVRIQGQLITEIGANLSPSVNSRVIDALGCIENL